MRRDYESRDDFGKKNTLRIKLDGVIIERSFRNRGEAIAYLQKKEQVKKYEIARRVRFIG